MPDTKFSWPRLREHIRRYLWIYLVGIAVCLVGTSLLWTTTRPRVPTEQSVVIYLADAYSNPAALDGVAEDMLRRTQDYDDTLLEVEFQSLQYNDQDYTGPILLTTRLAVGEGDAFLASQSVMDALVQSQVLVHLDDYVAQGWMADYGLEPYYVTYTDEETGESETYLGALRLDSVDSLLELGAFNNRGAYLCVAWNGGNVDTTMRALEVMIEDLTEGAYASADDTQPAA